MDLELAPWQIEAIKAEIIRLRDNPEFFHVADRVSRVSGVPLATIADTAVNLLTMRAALTAEGAMAIVSEELSAW